MRRALRCGAIRKITSLPDAPGQAITSSCSFPTCKGGGNAARFAEAWNPAVRATNDYAQSCRRKWDAKFGDHLPGHSLALLGGILSNSRGRGVENIVGHFMRPSARRPSRTKRLMIAVGLRSSRSAHSSIANFSALEMRTPSVTSRTTAGFFFATLIILIVPLA